MGDLSRVVDVVAHGHGFGSGYLVAAHYVLTAKHVIQTGDHPHIRLLSGDVSMPCTVIWRGTDTDTALLRIDDDPPAIEDLHPVRLGEVVSLAHDVPCFAVGFPWFQEQPDKSRPTEQMRGSISAGTGQLDGRYHISVYTTVAEAAGKQKVWSGMSGAAVLGVDAPDTIVGVITEQTRFFKGGRLTAEKISRIVTDRGFADEWRAATAMDPILEPVELAQLLDPPQPIPAESPAWLLHPRHEAVKFQGRSDELQGLRSWCRGRGFGLRLLVGPGGQGKTRLARELARLLREEGWVTGWLQRSPTQPDIHRLGDNQKPVLLIADYAETRDTQQLHQVISACATQRDQPLRLLLIARSAGGWWAELEQELGPDAASAVRAAQTQALDTLVQNDARARATEFTRAITDLIDAMRGLWSVGAAESIRAPDDIGGPRYASVLTLHMAALVALLQSGAGAEHVDPEDTVEDVLLKHERRYWQNTARARQLQLDADVLDQAVATAALLGAHNRAEAMKVLASTPYLADQTNDTRLKAAKTLHDLYPAEQGFYWGTVQPDRLAEHFVVRQLTADSDLAMVLLTGRDEDSAIRALTVLARAARHLPDQSRHLVATALAEDIDDLAGPVADVAYATGGGLREVLLAALRDHGLSGETLERFAERLPMVAEFAEVGLTVTDLGLKKADGDRKSAEWLFFRGVWLWHAGDLAGAMTAADESVGAMQQLLAANPEKYYQLSQVVMLQSFVAHDRGDHERALACAQRAIKHLLMVNDDTDRRGERLGPYLFFLALRFTDVGRHDDALQEIDKCIKHEEQRAIAHEKSRPKLVLARSQRASILIKLGHLDQAIAAAQDAVQYCRTLPVADIALAAALSNLRVVIEKAEFDSKALDIVEETVSVRRRLTAVNPDRFETSLCVSLCEYANLLNKQERVVDAMKAYREAVDRLRPWVKIMPNIADILARSLLFLAVQHERLEQTLKITSITEEALALTGGLLDRDRRKYLHLHASAAFFHTVSLYNSEQFEGCVAAAPEALVYVRDAVLGPPSTLDLAFHDADFVRCLVGIFQYTAWSLENLGSLSRNFSVIDLSLDVADEVANRGSINSEFVDGINSIARLLVNAHVYDRALTAIRLELRLRRRFGEADPEGYSTSYAKALIALFDVLGDVEKDDSEEQIAALAEALVVLTPLIEDDANADIPTVDPLWAANMVLWRIRTNTAMMAAVSSSLAPTSTVQDNTVRTAGERLAGLKMFLQVIQRCLGQYRTASLEDPSVIAFVQGNIGHVLAKAGVSHRESAIAALRHATEIYQQYLAPAARDPSQSQSPLLLGLLKIFLELAELGRPEEALTQAANVVKLYRQLADRDPGQFQLPLGLALRNTATILAKLGRHNEAVVAAEEDADIQRTRTADDPAAYSAGLASALDYLVKRLTDAGKTENAIEICEERISVHRRLIATGTTTSVQKLAWSLVDLSWRLVRAKRERHAMRALHEAVVIYRRLAREDPTPYLAKLEDGLKRLVGTIDSAGRGEALGLRRERLTVLRQLAFRLTARGLVQQACALQSESIAVYRTLLAKGNKSVRDFLSWTCNDWAVANWRLGNRDAAVAAMQEAIDADWLVPRHVSYSLARSVRLNICARNLSKAGCHTQAIAVAQAATEIWAELVDGDPKKFETEYCSALRALRDVLRSAGQPDQANDVHAQAMAVLARSRQRDYRLPPVPSQSVHDRLAEPTRQSRSASNLRQEGDPMTDQIPPHSDDADIVRMINIVHTQQETIDYLIQYIERVEAQLNARIDAIEQA